LIKNGGEGSGCDIKAVSELLGHADVGTTLKIYHHVSDEAIEDMHHRYGTLKGPRMVSVIA